MQATELQLMELQLCGYLVAWSQLHSGSKTQHQHFWPPALPEGPGEHSLLGPGQLPEALRYSVMV